MDYPTTTDDPVRDAEAWMEYQDDEAYEYEDCVAGWIDQLWEDCLDPYKAEKLAYEYECLVNDVPAIFETAAHARLSGDYEYLGRMVMARVERWVKQVAEIMAEETK